MDDSRRLLQRPSGESSPGGEGASAGELDLALGTRRSPRVASLKERFGLEGYVISAVHLLKGIGILAGLEVMEVPGRRATSTRTTRGKPVMRWRR